MPRVRDWGKYFNELNDWVIQNQRIPRTNSKDETEKALRNGILYLQDKYKKGNLSQEMVDILNGISPRLLSGVNKAKRNKCKARISVETLNNQDERVSLADCGLSDILAVKLVDCGIYNLQDLMLEIKKVVYKEGDQDHRDNVSNLLRLKNGTFDTLLINKNVRLKLFRLMDTTADLFGIDLIIEIFGIEKLFKEIFENRIYTETMCNRAKKAITTFSNDTGSRLLKMAVYRSRDKMTYMKIGKILKITGSRTQQLAQLLYKRMRHRSRCDYIRGYRTVKIKQPIQTLRTQTTTIKEFEGNQSIDALGMTNRLYNVLRRNYIDTVDQFISLMESTPETGFELINKRGVGQSSLEEAFGVYHKLTGKEIYSDKQVQQITNTIEKIHLATDSIEYQEVERRLNAIK